MPDLRPLPRHSVMMPVTRDLPAQGRGLRPQLPDQIFFQDPECRYESRRGVAGERKGEEEETGRCGGWNRSRM